MYAINEVSFRAIGSSDDLQPGETAVDMPPETLLAAVVANDQRLQRDGQLRACDWTQMADAKLSAADQAAWSEYRQALRDVPAQTGFPLTIDWPIAPTTK